MLRINKNLEFGTVSAVIWQVLISLGNVSKMLRRWPFFEAHNIHLQENLISLLFFAICLSWVFTTGNTFYYKKNTFY